MIEINCFEDFQKIDFAIPCWLKIGIITKDRSCFLKILTYLHRPQPFTRFDIDLVESNIGWNYGKQKFYWKKKSKY